MDIFDFLISLLFIISSIKEKQKTYRIAAIEFEPYFEKGANQMEMIEKNAKRHAEFAMQAKQQGAILVAFPEYGIPFYDPIYNTLTRDEISQIVPIVPDPKKITWNPCQKPESYKNSNILKILSCAARNNSIAILANMVTNQPCHPETKENCPPDHKFLYNTNVVFDKQGIIIAAYHKKHLFNETLLDSPPKAEYVIFEIESIKFATFICFDINYEDPAVDLVFKKGIKNIIFSTAWTDEMPFFLATQTFSSWARGLGVNLIASGHFNPENSRLGSGIYSSQHGPLAETYNVQEKNKLLVADLPLEPLQIPDDPNLCLETFSSDTNLTLEPSTNKSYVIYDMTEKLSSYPGPPIHTVYNTPLSNFHAYYLNESEGNINWCNRGVCCHLTYTFTNNDDPSHYALITFDGTQSTFDGVYNLGLQVCAVFRCEIKGDIETCGRVPKTNSSAVFTNLTLVAQMEANEVFPSVVKTDLQTLPSKEWSFSQSKCEDKKIMSKINIDYVKSLMIMCIFSRVYDRDYINTF